MRKNYTAFKLTVILSVFIIFFTVANSVRAYDNPQLDKLFYSWKDEGNSNNPAQVSRAKVRFLSKNINSWFARWFLLANARKRIDVVYFSFFNDPFGRAFLGYLYEKALKGIKD
jgi:RimJ/RimL family protein N-acetyltransferase